MDTPLKINPGNGPRQRNDLDHVDYISAWPYFVDTYGEEEAKKRWKKLFGDKPVPNKTA